MSNLTSEVAPAVPAEAVVRRAFGAEDERDFKEPPKVFWPETWFHFLGSNVRREGITADLEAIAGAGIGGVQLFHGNMGGAPFPGVREPVPPPATPPSLFLHLLPAPCSPLLVPFLFSEKSATSPSSHSTAAASPRCGRRLTNSTSPVPLLPARTSLKSLSPALG